ncbi:MAG TPA: hypothetical protein VLF43_04455, partial [Candidatus Saccharimonadales bacterium]|nr:hypothetical protein [Candidatus Saccharimonadales bacterium]
MNIEPPAPPPPLTGLDVPPPSAVNETPPLEPMRVAPKPPAYMPEPRKGNTKKIVLWIVIVVVLIAAAIVATLLLTSKKAASPTQHTSTTPPATGSNADLNNDLTALDKSAAAADQD